MSETGKAGQGAIAAKCAYWEQCITEWQQSGQSQKAFYTDGLSQLVAPLLSGDAFSGIGLPATLFN